jgi:hypothetical protein
MKPNQFTAQRIEEQIRALLADFPQLADDEDLKNDMISGSTSFDEALSMFAMLIQETKVQSMTLKAVIGQLTDRLRRFDRREEFARAMIHKLMTTADMKKIELPVCTISVVNTAPKIIITDEAALPEHFLRVKMEPDKTAIKTAIERGTHVPGATLSNAGTTIQIR